MAIVVNKNVTSGEMPLVIPDGAVTTDKLADGSVTTAKIASEAITAALIGLAHTTESNGWTKLQLSSTVVLHMQNGTITSESWSGYGWKMVSATSKPADLNLSNTFFGLLTGKPVDNAINLTGYVSQNTGDAYFQSYNAYGSGVTTNIDWTAFIVELLA